MEELSLNGGLVEGGKKTAEGTGVNVFVSQAGEFRLIRRGGLESWRSSKQRSELIGSVFK